jgi:excisionase family DNA binding protein
MQYERGRPAAVGLVERDDLITTREAARLAGVGPTAVKRWADAGLLRCLRTAGGHRRFRRGEVARLVGGRPEGSALEREPWVGALLHSADARALEAFLLAERARAGSWDRVAAVAGEALAEVGRLGREGAVTILEEHLASERLARALARAAEAIPLAPDAPRALLACAEGDEHTLGLALVEIVLREAGWAALWAGRRTPVADLESAVRAGKVAMLAVSASEASVDALALRRQAESLGRSCRAAGVLLALGGRGRWPDRPRHGTRFTEFEAFHRWAAAERARIAGPPA